MSGGTLTVFLFIVLGNLIAQLSGALVQTPKKSETEVQPKDERYRPQLHFSIPEHWTNDPNGMVYLNGEFHLYYQYNPNDVVWGPMHWGHSVSTNLLSWTELPIALYPDDLGTIFSGSSVVDLANSSGLQNGSNPLMVAIFTHAGETQQQSIAFSNDNGRTYTKYDGNPVISNPGLPDFRDPKVILHEDSWVMVVAGGNKIMFYGSKNLKTWELMSEFGAEPAQGSHSGTWECPDLLKMTMGTETVWVLLVSSFGGPNGGSGTQYFIGEFDGKVFRSSQFEPLWMEWGLDNYAGVTFSNDPQNRNVFMGWMSNLDYSNSLPTIGWTGQMTLPRVLDIKLVNGQLRLQSEPPQEFDILNKLDQVYNRLSVFEDIAPDSVLFLSREMDWVNPLMYLEFSFDISEFGKDSSIAICFLNSLGEEICTGFDNGRERNLFVDRERSGNVDFHPTFKRRPTGKRELSDPNLRFQIYLDTSAIEVFVDSGLSCFTVLFYPNEPLTQIEIRHHAAGDLSSKLTLKSTLVQGLRSIYELLF